MADPPVFRQVDAVVSDMDTAIRFYQLLGLDVRPATGEWPPGSGARHVAAQAGEAASFDLDNVAMARIWGDAMLEPGTTVLGFSLASRSDVDDKYAELTAAGYPGRLQPNDAFFGARYAIVETPDGHLIGLMSPVDPAHQCTPQI
jgi:catechol 2,3-dioxygenase-like lactoylglutathione lyase family enzyme